MRAFIVAARELTTEQLAAYAYRGPRRHWHYTNVSAGTVGFDYSGAARQTDGGNVLESCWCDGYSHRRGY
jgi:hypothetical protein